MMSRFYNAISLYEYVCILGILFLAIVGNNIFLFVLLIAMMSKDIPVALSKHFVRDPRPEGATDCNLLNVGNVSVNGFPSGHVTFSTFLFVYSIYEYKRIQFQHGKSIWGLLLVTGLFFVLMPIARIQKKCHSTVQVFGGMITGAIWALLFIILEEKYLIYQPQYRMDKQRFINSLFNR